IGTDDMFPRKRGVRVYRNGFLSFVYDPLELADLEREATREKSVWPVIARIGLDPRFTDLRGLLEVALHLPVISEVDIEPFVIAGAMAIPPSLLRGLCS